jgi:hypothetical protein
MPGCYTKINTSLVKMEKTSDQKDGLAVSGANKINGPVFSVREYSTDIRRRAILKEHSSARAQEPGLENIYQPWK